MYVSSTNNLNHFYIFFYPLCIVGGCLLYFTATNYDPKSAWVGEAMDQSL